MTKLSTLRERLLKYYVVVLIGIITVSASVLIALDGYLTYKNWRENHAGKMEEAANSVSRQIEIYLHEVNISAQLFADAYSKLFWQLNLGPGNETLFNELSDKLGDYLLNYNSMTVTDSQGKLLYDDFGEKVGEACRDDIDAYRENQDVYKPYIHPGPASYHFDIMVPWRYQELGRGVFFISIIPEKISQIIRNSERDGYHLVLVRDDLTELIEVNSAGSRDVMDGEHHLTQQDQLEGIEGAEISNARWIAKAIPDQNFISNKRDDILNNRLQLVFILLGFGSILAFTVFKMEVRRSQVEQAEHKAMKAAQAANLAKSQFLSNMSHELRTPLNAILGFGQLLNGSKKLSTDTIQEYSNEIIKAGEHLLALINDVLDLSRIEAGQIVVRQESIMIKEIAEDCITQVDAGLADQLNVAITDQTEDRGLVVIADHLRLKQALLNLLSNAVKYNYEGGNVFFRASPASDESLRIEISDNGMGIAEGHLDRLFEPFERLDFDNSDIEGTGIGLAVTKQLVEAMGGKIGVTSTKGEGSTFWIELPRGKGSDIQSNIMATSRPLASADKAAGNIKVLYIEDNAVNARVVSAALTNRGGYDVLVSKTAEEGLTLAEQEMPDIILMDINLPGIDGYAALKEIRNIKVISSIPVLAVTAKVMEQDIEEGKKVGFDDYLAKPININLLYETIDKYVSVVTDQPLNVD